MIAESVARGGALVSGNRLLIGRARVLAEHGVASSEDAWRFDEVVRLLGGSICRTRTGNQLVWELGRAALEASVPAAAASDAGEGTLSA
jgi:hypothetical protein